MDDSKMIVYDMDELAELLHVTKRTIYNYIKAGKIRPTRIGNKWIITRKALEEQLQPEEPRRTKRKC